MHLEPDWELACSVSHQWRLYQSSQLLPAHLVAAEYGHSLVALIDLASRFFIKTRSKHKHLFQSF